MSQINAEKFEGRILEKELMGQHAQYAKTGEKKEKENPAKKSLGLQKKVKEESTR